MDFVTQILALLSNAEVFDLIGQIYRAAFLLGSILGPLFAALFG